MAGHCGGTCCMTFCLELATGLPRCYSRSGENVLGRVRSSDAFPLSGSPRAPARLSGELNHDRAPPAPVRKGFFYHCLGCNCDSATVGNWNWILSDHISSVLRSIFSTSSVKVSHRGYFQRPCVASG